MRAEKGTPINIHCPNPMGGRSGKREMYCEARTIFGGGPIRVAIPAMLAESAIAGIMAVGRKDASFNMFLSCRWSITEMEIGSIIIAVAVLLTHIEINAVAIMKPRRRRDPFVPTMEIVARAIRRWRFHFWMDIATKKPPMKRTILESI